MNHRIFFYVNVTKTGSDGVLRKATEIAARSGYQCKVYEDASCMFADCIEEDEDEPACIVTIGGDGTTLRGESGDRNHYSDSWNQPWQNWVFQ